MKNSYCLVLNRNFYATHVMLVHKAVSLVYQGHAVCVDEDYNIYDFDAWAKKSAEMDPAGDFISSPSVKFAVPAVIRLTRYDKLPPSEVKFTFDNLCDHSGHVCSYCNKQFPRKDLNRDHVIPRSRGGSTDWNNIVLSCKPCNLKKADKTPEEAGMKLRASPARPPAKGPLDRIFKSSKVKVNPVWLRFVDSEKVEQKYMH